MKIVSTPIDRYSLFKLRALLPAPAGCQECLKVVPGDWIHGSCNHETFFQSIADELRARGLQEAGGDVGSYRVTYMAKSGRYVYKVPKCDDGYRDNWLESLAWKDRAHFVDLGGTHIGHRIMPCRILPSGVLVMERATRTGRHYSSAWHIDPSLKEDPARHAISGIDNCQGGLDRHGKFKLYDYTHWVKIIDPLPPGMMAL